MALGGIRFREIRDKGEWQRLHEGVPFKHMTQAWGFGEAKRVTGWRPKRLAIERDGEVLAICQLLQKMVAGMPVATRINLGPLMMPAHDERELEVTCAIRKRWRFFRGPLLIAPAIAYTEESDRAVKAGGLRLRNGFRWSSSRLDLTREEDDLRKALNGKWRNQLTKSEQAGVQLVKGNAQADADWIIARHAEHQGQKGFDGPDTALLHALYGDSPRDFTVYRAAHDGQDIGGVVVYRFGDTAHYYIGWNSAEGRKLNSGNFLLWNAVLDLKRQGCSQFDLGGHGLTGSSGFTGFKLGMNGDCYETVGEFFCF